MTTSIFNWELILSKKWGYVHTRPNGKKSLAEITESLGVPESTLYGWVIEFKKSGKESFKPKELSAQEKELLLIKKELADIKMERDILKKALAIFSQKNKTC